MNMQFTPTLPTAYGFCSLGKLKGKNILLIAARHNKRTNQSEISKSEKINPSLSHLNESFMGGKTPEEVAELAKSIMEKNGINKLRKDAVLGIECLISIPTNHSINELDFFQLCANWIKNYFGCHVLSADIHRDESCPHCHILLLPLVEGRMVGSSLMGNKKNLAKIQESFYQEVAKNFGFQRPPKKINAAQSKKVAAEVLNHLVSTQDPSTKSKFWPSIVEAIYKFPIGFANALEIQFKSYPKRPQRTMTQIFTSKGKGKKNESICSVGFASKNQPNDNSNGVKVGFDIQTSIVREDEISCKSFNPETGEFFPEAIPYEMSKQKKQKT